MNKSAAKTRDFPKTVTRQELLVDGSDAQLRKLLYEITALAGRIEAMRANFATTIGVSKPQYSLLLYIAQHEGENGLTATQVASALKVSSAHVVTEANSLIAAGLVAKDRNPEDGRSVLLTITDNGMERIQSLSPMLQLVNDELFGSLTKSSFSQVTSAVAAILEDAENVLAKLPAYIAQK